MVSWKRKARLIFIMRSTAYVVFERFFSLTLCLHKLARISAITPPPPPRRRGRPPKNGAARHCNPLIARPYRPGKFCLGNFWEIPFGLYN
jgi:hypothetical protein